MKSLLEMFEWIIGRKAEEKPAEPRRDVPLLQFRHGGRLTVEDTFNNVLFIGSKNSGKTSSAKTLYRAFLKEGFGGLVLCVKSKQISEFQELCQECRRAGDLIVFGKGEKHVFNPLQEASNTEATSLLLEIGEILSQRRSSEVSENEGFFRQQCQMALRNLVVLCRVAKGHLEIPEIGKLFAHRATSFNQLADPTWRKKSVLAEALDSARERAGKDTDLEMAIEYFEREFLALGDRLQGSVAATVSGTLDHLRRPLLAGLFGGESTFTMNDLLYKKKICVVGMPTLGWDEKDVSGDEGRIANGVLQFCFLRAATRGKRETDAFLISDECQETVSRELREKLSVLREYRVATVLLTQDLAVMNARVGEVERDALFSNIETKVFLKQNHAKTRRWAAEEIEEVKQAQSQRSIHWGKGAPTHGEQESIVRDFRVAPIEFLRLKNGTEKNKCVVQSIILRGGELLREGWHQETPGERDTVKIA